MALFNFFSSKSTGNTSTLGSQIVVFDLDSLESKNVNWSFLESFENPELWIFTSNKESQKLKELEEKYLAKIYSLPEDSRQSPFWVLGVVMLEMQSLKELKKLTFVATLPYYQAICDYLKQRNIPVEFLQIEGTINKLSITTKTKQSVSSKVNKSEDKEKAEKKSKKYTKKFKLPKIKSLNQEELQKICDAFQEHFEIEGIYEKKALGEIVKIATGKTVQKVFHTRNAKLYVGCLYHHGIIHNENENDFKLLKYPTVDIFPKEVKVFRKKYHKKKG